MKHAFVVRGAKWGDEGKGRIVADLAQWYDADLVVRDVGGAQAAHHVVREDGTWHRFQQFGSATFQGVPTFLSQHFVVDPFELAREAEALQQKGVEDPYSLMYISESALIATPMHKYGDDQWRKANPGISTCGMGVGEARWLDSQGYRITVADATRPYAYGLLRDIQNFYNEVEFDFHEMQQRMCEILERCKIIGNHEWEMLRNFSYCTIFEGAQGALLDTELGDKPYVTSSKTDYSNAEELLEGYKGKITRVAVMRSYETRHGNGEFIEDPKMIQALPEVHNKNNEFQGRWRVGEFNLEATRRGLEILKGTDYIALTHLDQVDLNHVWLERQAGVPVGIRTHGPTHRYAFNHMEL